MAEMITKLTPEQEALMPVVRDEWLAIGLATADEINKAEARAATIESYRCADLKAPEEEFIFFGRSPMEGALIVAVCKDLWENQNQTVPTWPKVNKLLAQYREMQAEQKPLPEQIKKLAQDAFQWACYGQHDAGWLAFYDYFQRIGVEGLEQLDGLKRAAKECGWWWPMSEIAVVTEKPNKLHLDDEGRLHGTESKAIEYNDDWGLYVINGVNVPEKVVMDPEELSTEEIIGEENAEIRRIMIERKTPEKFAEEADYEVLSTDEDSDGRERHILQIDLGRGDPWTAVEVQNSTLEPDGSRRKFVIPVPHTLEPMTPQNAVAWTFGFENPDDYSPSQES